MNSPLKFSIVIPAHNEERYLEDTLSHLAALSYPVGNYETIVVENGSNDRTLEVARKFENDHVLILQSGKGVSKAKNVGIDHLSPASDWVIFLDADTILEKDFLNELNAFLSRPNSFTVGTVTLRPSPETLKAKIWFKIYDLGHWLTSTSYSIKMVKRSLFLPAQADPPLRFDENLVTAEDLHMIQQARAHGKFFFLRTKSVLTSTRRFEKLGWWYILFYWTFVAILPEKWQRHFSYDVVR